MIKMLKHLELLLCIKFLVASDIVNKRCKNQQNLNNSRIIDSESSRCEHLTQIEDDFLQNTKFSHEIQTTCSSGVEKNLGCYGNDDYNTIGQSYIMPCETNTCTDIYDDVINYVIETPRLYKNDHKNLKTIDPMLSDASLSGGLENDELQCFNEDSYKNIIPSQLDEYSDFLNLYDQFNVLYNNSDVIYAAACPLQCIENGTLCLCFSVDKYLQSEMEISTEKLSESSQNLAQGLCDSTIKQTFDNSGLISDNKSLHLYIDDISNLSQTKNLGTKTIPKKRKLSKYKIYKSKEEKIMRNPALENRKKNNTQRLSIRKSVKETETKNKILITKTVNNLYYYRSIAKSLQEEEIPNNITNSQKYLNFLEKNQSFLHNLNEKTKKLFGDQKITSFEDIEKYRQEIDLFVFLKQNESENIDKTVHRLLVNEKVLIIDIRENNFVQTLYEIEREKLRKNGKPVFEALTIDFLKNLKNFIPKKIVILNFADINCKSNVKKDDFSKKNIVFKCQNTYLNTIINDIFYLFCRNKFNGDEGCIIKIDIFEKIQKFCELPKFLDLVFLTDYNFQNSIIDEIIKVLNSFRNLSKRLQKARSKNLKSIYLNKLRLHVLQYLKLLYGKSTTYALYSHIMAIYSNNKSNKFMKTKDASILWFSFFALSIDHEIFKSLWFFNNETYNLFFVLNQFDKHYKLLYHLLHIHKVNTLFLINFNRYMNKCLNNCGNKIDEFQKIYCLFIRSQKVAFITNNQHDNSMYFYEICSFHDFIQKLIIFYYETIKKNFSGP